MGATIRIALIFGSQVYLDLKMINHEFQLVMPLPHVSSQIATADDVEFTPDISAFPELTFNNEMYIIQKTTVFYYNFIYIIILFPFG